MFESCQSTHNMLVAILAVLCFFALALFLKNCLWPKNKGRNDPNRQRVRPDQRALTWSNKACTTCGGHGLRFQATEADEGEGSRREIMTVCATCNPEDPPT